MAKLIIALAFAPVCMILHAESKKVSNDEDLRAKYGPEFVRPTEIPYSAENPFSIAKSTLGRALFFDQRLSRKQNQSCASCHHPGLGWEMGLPKALGAQEMPRKSQTLLNLAWAESWFWDGRSDSFPSQFHVALTSPKALDLESEELVRRIRQIKEYAPMFQRAFPKSEINERSIALALEIYQRGIVSGPAPFDRWLAGDDASLSPDAKAGAALFAGKARCIACHSGWNFTDNGFHDIGLNDADVGRGKIVPLPSMQHAFKTPTLRSIRQRAPYMHDGSLRDLASVVDHYARGAKAIRPGVATELGGFVLTNKQKLQLIEFLRSLTGQDVPVTVPQIPM